MATISVYCILLFFVQMQTLHVSLANTLCVYVHRPACGIADHVLRAPTTFGAIVLDVDQLADTLEPETL